MKIVAIMPIKMNNERLPGKNTKLLGNVPLMDYELESLKQTRLLDEIYVYCSSDLVKEYIPEGITYLKLSLIHI